MRIVVVGAGLGGLSAAAHLSKRGHQVTVLERDSDPGGRAGVFAQSGFRLDTGPTLLTMPEVLTATFAAAGSELADFVRLHPVDPMYRAVFGDGSTLYIRSGREAMTEEIRAFSGPHDAEAFGRFSDWLERLHRIEMSHLGCSRSSLRSRCTRVSRRTTRWRSRPLSPTPTHTGRSYRKAGCTRSREASHVRSNALV
jgi:phytoene dehydrogenase-like protein